ncbi:recombinase family protein [Lysinibacillus sp. NPDC097231]|uniref:recombinase family protein n=1 Tax=Lysinibacillus sp. NPDC097231 TaxID=3364142 RepID=UPI00381505B7
MARKRAVVYTRVSTEKEEQKLSLAMQREVYEEYCARENLELIEIFADEGFSGTNARREKFIEMMYKAGLDFIERKKDGDIFETSDREPEFDYIITKDVSRYARNEEIGMSTAKQLRALGVYIRFEHGGVSTEDKNWKLMLTILFSVAEGYSQDLSEKIKFTKEHNARKHRYRPARLPYGFTWDKYREIVKVPEQAEIVEYIFNSYAKKGGMILSKELNEKKIPTQRNHFWSSDKITRIIKNRIYTGTAVVHQTYKDDVTSTERKRRDESEFIIIPNAVPHIVTLEQYEEVNKIRESRINKGDKKRGRKVSYNDIYFQKIKCGVCGKGFKKHTTTGSGKKKKINYMCMSRVKHAGCGCRGVALNNLNKGLEEININFLADTMKEQVQYKELMDSLATELARVEGTRQQLQEQIDRLDSECDSLSDSIKVYNKKGNTKLANRYEKKFDIASNELEELEVQLENINIEKIQRLKKKVEKKKDLIQQMRKNQSFTVEEKLQFLQKVVVTDYELEYFFTMLNYDDEIQEFNSIFKENPIENQTETMFNGITVRRNHKEAREHWNQLVEDYEAREQHEKDYPYQDEEMLLAQQYEDWEEAERLRAEGKL